MTRRHAMKLRKWVSRARRMWRWANRRNPHGASVTLPIFTRDRPPTYRPITQHMLNALVRRLP